MVVIMKDNHESRTKKAENKSIVMVVVHAKLGRDLYAQTDRKSKGWPVNQRVVRIRYREWDGIIHLLRFCKVEPYH